MNLNNNVSKGRSNGNASPETEKARPQIAPWIASQNRQQEYVRIYGTQNAQFSQDVYSTNSTTARTQTAGNFGGHFLYPSNTAPSVYSPGATQAQVSSSEGIYAHHMISGPNALQQTALAAAGLRGYNQKSSNIQSLTTPFLNMRNRLQSRSTSLTTTTTSINRYPNSYHPNVHSHQNHPNQHNVNQHSHHHRPMYHSVSSHTSDHFLGRRAYSTSSSASVHSDTAGSIISPTISPNISPNISPKSSQVRYPDHFRHGSVIRLASGTLKRVEELKTKDFLDSGNISDDLCIDNSTVIKMDNYTSETAQLGFSVGSDHVLVSVEATLEHPFFVFGRGWSSCSPSKTMSRYNLVCHPLEVGDICISLTHKETNNVDPISNDSRITTSSTEKPVKDSDKNVLPESSIVSSPTTLENKSPKADSLISNKDDSDVNVDSPVIEKKRKISE